MGVQSARFELRECLATWLQKWNRGEIVQFPRREMKYRRNEESLHKKMVLQHICCLEKLVQLLKHLALYLNFFHFLIKFSFIGQGDLPIKIPSKLSMISQTNEHISSKVNSCNSSLIGFVLSLLSSLSPPSIHIYIIYIVCITFYTHA